MTYIRKACDPQLLNDAASVRVEVMYAMTPVEMRQINVRENQEEASRAAADFWTVTLFGGAVADSATSGLGGLPKLV